MRVVSLVGVRPFGRADQDKPGGKLRQSIVKQMSLIMGLLILFILIGGAVLYWADRSMLAKFEEQANLLEKKAALAAEISQSMSNLMIEYRGYIAYQLPQFLPRIDANKKRVDEGIAQFRQLALTEVDREHLTFLEEASQSYMRDWIEVGKRMIESGQREALTTITAEAGYLDFSDELRTRHQQFAEQMLVAQVELRTENDRRVKQHTLYYAEYLLLIALIIGVFAMRFARDVGKPLRTLALFSEHYEDVKIINLPYDKREDEIGYLTRSLKQIFLRFKANERRLLDQMEELKLQQDEMMEQKEQLIMQQDELHHTRAKLREIEQRLADRRTDERQGGE